MMDKKISTEHDTKELCHLFLQSSAFLPGSEQKNGYMNLNMNKILSIQY
jgi:hypothetical protein